MTGSDSVETAGEQAGHVVKALKALDFGEDSRALLVFRESMKLRREELAQRAQFHADHMNVAETTARRERLLLRLLVGLFLMTILMFLERIWEVAYR